MYTSYNKERRQTNLVIDKINIPEIHKNWVNIPKLAKGAVLEGGNPFLAWVNDQPKGQKNIETPLSTMIEAFKQARVSSQSKNIII